MDIDPAALGELLEQRAVEAARDAVDLVASVIEFQLATRAPRSGDGRQQLCSLVFSERPVGVNGRRNKRHKPTVDT